MIHDEDPGYVNAHIVEVLSEDVEDAYLACLRSIGVSYVFAGEKTDKPLFYDEVVGDYQLMKAEVLGACVWLRYHSNSYNAKPRLKLSAVIGAIEAASDEWQYFYDLKKHESIWFSEYGGFNDEEERELLDEEPERFIRLPSKYEIHEYSIMEEFVETLPEGAVQNQLLHAIQGRGAFRRFKDGVNRLGIAKQWYDYQDNAHREIAIRWCRDNEYEYWEE